GGELEFGDEQPDAERNQQQARHVDRQHLKGEEREQQADTAGDARQRGSRIPELDGEAEQTQREEQVGDLRMRERAEEALPPRHLDRLAWRAGGVERLLRAVEAADRAA